MTWRTHVLGGIGSLWLLAPALGSAGNAGVLAAIAALGALLPDLDATRSKVRSLSAFGIQPFNPIGAAVNATFGHRGFLHSPWALAVVAGIAGLVWARAGWGAAAAFWLGYASHLALDACTVSGIPRNARTVMGRAGRIFMVPTALRVVTGSPGEDAYFALVAIAASALLLFHLLIASS